MHPLLSTPIDQNFRFRPNLEYHCTISALSPFTTLTLTLSFAMRGGKSKAVASSKDDTKVAGKRKAAGKVDKKAKRGRKAAKDANKPKRPPSAFFIFMEEFRKTFQEKHPENKKVSVVSKACGDKWKSMSESEKAPYVAKAAKRKAEYEKIIASFDKKQSESSGGNASAEEEVEEEGSDKSKSEVEDDEDGNEEEEEDEE